MGNQDDFISRFPALEDFIRAYRKFVKAHGYPIGLYVPNEKRMQDMNEAAEIIHEFTLKRNSDLEFSVNFDEDDPSSGWIEVRGYHWGILNDESFPDFQYAEMLADSIDIDSGNDEKFVYTLGFNDLMTLKRTII